ncbi:hypothetical protein Aglo01_29110 [Actinokineospora globicatena]|nr:hypothetical protein Aglo01_29110 [Actinokineospora globicatena]GLW84907.1 hypothetical protein Aglo02_25470 [Actinokineospora globicatena]
MDLRTPGFKINCRWVPVDWPRDAPRRGWGPGWGGTARARSGAGAQEAEPEALALVGPEAEPVAASAGGGVRGVRVLLRWWG